MGIDPVTHKPISSTTDEHHHKKGQEEACVVAGEEQRSENMILQCTQSQEEEKGMSVSSSFDFMETDTFLQGSPGFCTDEVPMIQPHEIIVPSASTTSYSSTSLPSSCFSCTPSVKAEDIQFPCMEWPEPIYLCGMEDDFGQWDLISNDGDGKLAFDPPNQHQRTTWDQESWN